MTDAPKIPRTPEGLALIPSILLTEAMEDFEAAVASDEYLIDMGRWHEPDKLGADGAPVCVVCLGGAVMAGQLKASPYEECTPSDFGRANELLLLALDSARKFDWYMFLLRVQLACEKAEAPSLPADWAHHASRLPDDYRRVPTCHPFDVDGFRPIMKNIVLMLRARGL